MIHSADPQSWPVVIIVSTHVVHPNVGPHFWNLAKQNEQYMHDPLGLTHSPASSDHYSHLNFVLFCEILKSGDGRVPRTYRQHVRNSDHYRPWLWVFFLSFLFSMQVVEKIKGVFIIDPRGRPTVATGSDHCFCTCRPSVRKSPRSKHNKFQAKTLFATGETVGLVEWIIDDTCLVLLSSVRKIFRPLVSNRRSSRYISRFYPCPCEKFLLTSKPKEMACTEIVWFMRL